MGKYDWLEKRKLRAVDQLKLWGDNPRLDPEEKHVNLADYASDLIAETGAYPSPTLKDDFDTILFTLTFNIANPEKLLIDSWIEQNNLNQYGDSKDTMYPGGTPLFDERTGERTDRYEYIVKKFPDRPWSK